MMTSICKLAILFLAFSTLVPQASNAAPQKKAERPQSGPSIEEAQGPDSEILISTDDDLTNQEAQFDLTRPRPLGFQKFHFELNLEAQHSAQPLEPMQTIGGLLGVGMTYSPSYEGYYSINALYSPSKAVIFKFVVNSKWSGQHYWRALLEHQNDPSKGVNSFVSLDHYYFGLGYSKLEIFRIENLNFNIDLTAGTAGLKFALGFAYVFL